MKTLILKKWAILFVALFVTAAVSAGNYVVDSSDSSVKWLGKKVTGEHSGAINIKEGTLEVSDGAIEGGTIIIDMQSLINEDIEDEEYKQKLVGHLKSDDFFGVETYPTAKLVITKVEKTEDKYTFSANLTIKGKTNPVTFSANYSHEGDLIKVEGKLIIDRSKYDVRYGSASFFDNLGDKMIHNDFTLDFTLVAKK